MNIGVILSKMKDNNIDGEFSCGRLYAFYSKNINILGLKIKTSNYDLGVYDEVSNSWYWYYEKKYRFFNKSDSIDIKNIIRSVNRISDSSNYFIK